MKYNVLKKIKKHNKITAFVFLFIYLITLFLTKIDGPFPYYKVGPYADWFAAFGTISTFIYLIYQDRKKEKDKQHGIIQAMFSELVQNQKRINADGIALIIDKQIPADISSQYIFSELVKNLPSNTANLIHAYFNDMQIYNAAIEQNENAKSIDGIVDIEAIKDWVKPTIIKIRIILALVLSEDLQGAEIEAKEEIDARDKRHKQLIDKK